jgi:hypothetical protein
MKELSAFKHIHLFKYCDIGSRMTHFGLRGLSQVKSHLHLLALLGAHHVLYVSRIRVKMPMTLRKRIREVVVVLP